MTGLWAFERQMHFQKYQGSAIVVRLGTSEYINSSALVGTRAGRKELRLSTGNQNLKMKEKTR